MKKILFVCLGNICRSSAAEGIFLKQIQDEGLERYYEIDSAGIISAHKGELPDERMRKHATKRGYHLVHRSRPIKSIDFENFDLIIGMDEYVIDQLYDKAPTLDATKKIKRMADYCLNFPNDNHIPDPYYGGADGFEHVLDLLEDGCRELLNSLEKD